MHAERSGVQQLAGTRCVARDEFVTVSAWCICGPKLESKIDAGTYVSRGSELWTSSGAGRRLSTTPEAEAWRWDDPKPQTIDRFHGAHFDIPDPTYDALMSWRTSLVPEDAECADYFDRIEPPIGSWDPNSVPADANFSACDASTPTSCCVTHRGHRP